MKKIFIALAFISLTGGAIAQNSANVKPGAPLDEQKKAQQLVPDKDPMLKYGKISIVKGTVDTAEQRFFVKDLQVTQPVYVAVYTDNPNDEVSIKLIKPSWLDVKREDNTKDKGGLCTFFLRVVNEFGIILKSAKGQKNFHLMVWVGDPVTFPMDGLFVTKATYEQQHGNLADVKKTNASNGPEAKSNTPLLIVVSVIAIALIGILVVMISNRKKASKTLCVVWLALALLGYSLIAKGQSSPPSTRQTLERFVDDLQHNSTWRENTADRLGDLNRFGQTINTLGASDRPIINMVRNGALQSENSRNMANGILAGMGRAGGQIAGGAHALQQFTELWPLLDPQERDEQPDFTPSGQPQLPTMCENAANPGGCDACYAASFQHLNDARTVLERLKSIYKRTKKLKKKSIAFGDNVAGMTGVAALAWQQQRVLIIKDYKTFITHYKTKYNELITNLHTALMEVDRCEATHGLADWYNRFGFMYYDFMKERYGVDSDDEEDS